MSIRNTAILVILVAIASAGLTRYCFPQVQVKEVQVDHDVVHNNIQTVIKTVTAKDGTQTQTETIVDNTIKSDFKKESLQENKQTQWMFDVGVRTDFSEKGMVYDLQAQRRILGPFFLGAKVSTDHSVGVSVGMEF